MGYRKIEHNIDGAQESDDENIDDNLETEEVNKTELPDLEEYKDYIQNLRKKLDQNEKIEEDDFQDLEDIRNSEPNEKDLDKFELEKLVKDYYKDLVDKSECPETLPDMPFTVSDLKKRTPEENAEKREEFVDEKVQLKREWEEINNRPWPKYEHDVYSSNGKLIRKAGSEYDAHHIQPLGMGGENDARNITPLSAEVHYDKQGVHAPNSPYSKMDRMLGGMD